MTINSNSDGLKPQLLRSGRSLQTEAGLQNSAFVNANVLYQKKSDCPVLLQKAEMKS